MGHSKGMGYLALAEAIRKVLLRGAAAPKRQVIPLPQGQFLVMPAADPEVALCKLVTVEAHRQPSVQGEVWAKRLDTGEVFHFPGEEITRKRTAALSLLAGKLLAPRQEGALLVVGPGVQGEAHLEAFAEGFRLSRVFVRGRGRERLEALVRKAQGMGLPAEEWRGEEIPKEVASLLPPPPVPSRFCRKGCRRGPSSLRWEVSARIGRKFLGLCWSGPRFTVTRRMPSRKRGSCKAYSSPWSPCRRPFWAGGWKGTR